MSGNRVQFDPTISHSRCGNVAQTNGPISLRHMQETLSVQSRGYISYVVGHINYKHSCTASFQRSICSMKAETCRLGVYDAHRGQYNIRWKASCSNLGLTRCRIVPRTARRTNTLAAATYAHPRNGFLPPIHETVEITNDFVPL